jgi:hypothetical protein
LADVPKVAELFLFWHGRGRLADASKSNEITRRSYGSFQS